MVSILRFFREANLKSGQLWEDKILSNSNKTRMVVGLFSNAEKNYFDLKQPSFETGHSREYIL